MLLGMFFFVDAFVDVADFASGVAANVVVDGAA